MQIFLTGFIRCLCGKIHARHGISITSKCKCGLSLYRKAWDFNGAKKGSS